MALDGITVAAITHEIKREVLDGRIYKIAQPENDEILITVKTNDGGTRRLFISVSASLPFVYFTEKNKQSPATAPNFCMLLRKHAQNGRITSVTQPGLERVIRIGIEHMDEMGDMTEKYLVIELMGKYSNIIFVDGSDTVIDSIKHISASVSSVREVLPGKAYFIPETQNKTDPLSAVERSDFMSTIKNTPDNVIKAVYNNFTGISPVEASDLCFRAGIDGNSPVAAIGDDALERLYDAFSELIKAINNGSFSPEIIYDKKGAPVDFAAVHLLQYRDLEIRGFDSVSEVLERFYAEKNRAERIKQRSADLRKIVSTMIERDSKKYDIQLKQLKSTEKKEKYRIYGELLNTYGYTASPGDKSLACLNYYSNEEILIPLDPQKTALENAQKYFERYQKLKRTEEAVTEQLKETKADLEHLLSVQASLDTIENEADIGEVRRELMEAGYIRGKGLGKGKKKTESGKPLHYVSSDGYDLYVGKNNFQNDYLTFKLANGNDWWFHSKKFPGSHVILKVRKDGPDAVPDRAFNEAGALAAYYSKGRDQSKVEIDYVLKKEVKKPAGSKPGFCVYYTNFSMAIAPGLEGLTLTEA